MGKQRRKERKGIRLAAAVFCAGMVLAGCGTGGEPSYTKQGMDAVAALDYDQALTLFQTAREKGEEERLIYRGMGIAYLGKTDYEAAITYLETALTLGGSRVEDLDFDINYYLATAYYKDGQFDEAVQAYNAILGLRPDETNAYYLRGCVKLSEGDFESAQGDFDTAVAKDPKNYDQMIRIYMVLEEYGYKEAGQVYLQNAMKENEKSISDYDMGRICYYMGNYENARNFLERLKTTTDYGAALYLGRTYEALGDYNYAASIYAGYTEYDQKKAEIYNQLGLCRMQMGEYESALTAFQTAMNIENNEMMQTLKFNEIITYEYMGDFKTAAALAEYGIDIAKLNHDLYCSN
ncbi:MAG: tetratricopeptide repeat protein, partial [Lachnospiraceae bacterium]|nr:tetratricopeptide repeat protein [Lachnospiraceae bacterium]